MDASPDLYAELLHLPPGPRPPHYYALLGLPLFEPDRKAIHAAVLRQTAELKLWVLDPRPGRMDRVQEMLNEVNRAGFVLEDPKTKADYDRRLAEQLGVPPPHPYGADIAEIGSSEWRSAAPTRDRTCRACGAAVDASHTFCPACGSTARKGLDAPARLASRRHAKVVALAVGASLLLALLFTAGLLVGRGAAQSSAAKHETAAQAWQNAVERMRDADRAFLAADRPASFLRARQALTDGEAALQEAMDFVEARRLFDEARAAFSEAIERAGDFNALAKARADAIAAQDREQGLAKELRRELLATQQRMALIEAERAAERKTPGPAPSPVKAPSVEATMAPPPKADSRPPASPATPKEATQMPAAVPAPKSAGAAPKPPTLSKLSPAEMAAAAAAYPALAAKLTEMKARLRYGEAIAACRLYLAAHAGTPQGDRVQADLNALRAEIVRIVDEHVRRFREAFDKGDQDAARQAIAALAAHEAPEVPEVREARERMLAQAKGAGLAAPADEAKYLAQWETPPAVARLLAELKSEKDYRDHAAKELKRLKHRAAIGGLIAALKDSEWYVAVMAMDALADIGDPIALPHIVPLTKAPNPAIRDAAARACRTLAAAPHDQFPEAWRLVDTRKVAADIADSLKQSGQAGSKVESRFQICLVEALAALEVREAAPAIRSLLDSKDPDVRKAASLAIKKLTGEDVPAEPPHKAPPETKAPVNAVPAPPPPKPPVPVRLPAKVAP